MITCRELIDFILDYLGGELPAPQQRSFEEHLAACPACVAYLESYKQTVTLGKQACLPEDDEVPEDVPSDLVKAVLSARRRE